MTSISGKTKVEMSGIQESDITIFEKVIPSNLSAVPETMKLHQVTSSRIRYVNRNISEYMKLENENINVLYIYDCIKSLKFKVMWHMANMIAKIFFQFVREQLVCLGYCK